MVDRLISDIFEAFASGGESGSSGWIDDRVWRQVLLHQNPQLSLIFDRLAQLHRMVGGETAEQVHDPRGYGRFPNPVELENGGLVNWIKDLYKEIYGSNALERLERTKTYSLKRVCPHGHQIADDEPFCPQCGLMPENDFVYANCPKDIRELIAESEKLIAGIHLPQDQAAPDQDVQASEPQKKTLRKVDRPMTPSETNPEPGTAIYTAQGDDGTLLLFPNLVRLIIDETTRDLPIRRISAVYFWEVENGENGCIKIERFLEQGDVENYEEVANEPNTIFFTADQQLAFQLIYDRLSGQVDALDNGTISSAPAAIPANYAPPPAIPAAPVISANPPEVHLAPPIPQAEPVPEQLVLEAQGNSEKVQLLLDRIRIVTSSGDSRDLPLAEVTSVQLQSAGGMGEGFIHFHRLIDDKDLGRAVPSAFAALPTDWSKVEVFRVVFKPEQESTFLTLKQQVENLIANRRSFESRLSLMAGLDLLERLGELRDRGLITQAEFDSKKQQLLDSAV